MEPGGPGPAGLTAGEVGNGDDETALRVQDAARLAQQARGVDHVLQHVPDDHQAKVRPGQPRLLQARCDVDLRTGVRAPGRRPRNLEAVSLQPPVRQGTQYDAPPTPDVQDRVPLAEPAGQEGDVPGADEPHQPFDRRLELRPG